MPPETPRSAILKDGRTIALRPLHTGDAAALAEFYASVPADDYRFYRAAPLTGALALAVAARADSETFVCTAALDEAGQIIGYAWYEWKDTDSVASHFGICIRRGWQDCGTGFVIASLLMERAQRVGPARMRLTVQTANPRAVALYRKLGFEIVCEQMRAANAHFSAEPEYAMERSNR